MTRFSIVTITWNAARALPRTLASVACQDYPHIEHLIIDGASKDDTLAIAGQYKATSRHQVVITSEPDRGLYDAMNKGLQRATGDYILFLNAGDTLHAPDTLQTVAQNIKALSSTDNCQRPTDNNRQSTENGQRPTGNAPGVVYGDTAITDSDGHFLHLRRLRPPEQLTWRSFRHGMLVCHQAFYARLDIARTVPYNLHYRHSADVDWCIRIMKEADRLKLPLVNTHTVVADFEEGGDTTQHHRASLMERFQVMRHHYGLLTTVAMHVWFVLRQIKAKYLNNETPE